jgi:carbon storage regulator CsrA
MQVFQRGVNESLMIGTNVVITVLEITPHCVRIAVEDPDGTPPYREETVYLENNDLPYASNESELGRHERALSGRRYLGW